MLGVCTSALLEPCTMVVCLTWGVFVRLHLSLAVIIEEEVASA